METFRALEQPLIIGVGGLAIWLGYLLFRHLPQRTDSEGKFRLPGGISIYISRVGPGVFFALFGSATVGLSFHYPLVVTEPASGWQISYFSSTGSSQEDDALPMARLRVRSQIGFVHAIPDALRSDLSDEERSAIARSLRETKLELIRCVWADWGDWDAFADWARRGASGPPPSGLRDAAAIYRHGLDSPS